jgi:hypothetical protein
MTSFVCNFRIKPDATEDQVRFAVAQCMHPPLPGLINFKLFRGHDGRYLERFNFDSIESMKFAAEAMTTTRQSPAEFLRLLMDTENCVPTVWMGPAHEVPTPLWPPGLGDDEMDFPATPRSATPPMSSASSSSSSSSSSQHSSLRDLAVDLLSGDTTSASSVASPDAESVIANASVSSSDLPEWGPAWQALSAGGQRTIMHMLNYWMPPRAAPTSPRTPHFGATFTTVLRGTPSKGHNSGPAYAVERPMRDRSAPRFRYQHPAYDAQPRKAFLLPPAGTAIHPPPPLPPAATRESPTRTILALREAPKDNHGSGSDSAALSLAARIAPPPVLAGAFGSSMARPSKRQTFCAAIVLEVGLPARCKCDTGVCAAPAVGDQILVRLAVVNGAGGETLGGLRAARVAAVSSWSKKRAGSASAVHPLMQRAWIDGSDDEHHRTMVAPQAAAALGAARAAAVGLPVAFEGAWCYHDLSCVVVAVRTAPMADVPRAQLLGMLEAIAREVYRTSGTPVEWVPHSRLPPSS